MLLLRGRVGSEGYLCWGTLRSLLLGLLRVRGLRALLVLRRRWDGERWWDGGVWGVRGSGRARTGVAGVWAGTGGSTGGAIGARSALLARVGCASVSDFVIIDVTFVLLDNAAGWAAANREAAGQIVGARRGPTHAERAL
jgi:hypothetical protein